MDLCCGVFFWDDRSTQQLLSSPVLEELSIEGCNWRNRQAVSTSAPKLWSLTIEEPYMLDDSDGCQVMINCDSLKSLNYSGELWNVYCVCNSTSLVKACITVSFPCERRERQIGYRTNKLLKGLTHVKNLKLTDRALKGIGWCQKDDGLLEQVPPCLLSHLKSIIVENFGGSEEELSGLKILLGHTPVLDRMVVSCSVNFSGDLKKQNEVHEELSGFSRASKRSELEVLLPVYVSNVVQLVGWSVPR